MNREPVLIGGILLALVNGVLALVGAGGLDDGFQLVDLVVVGGPVAVALGIRQKTWSQLSVDLVGPRDVQRSAVRRRKRR